MKKILSILTLMLTVTAANAQRVPSKIELKNNTTVTFQKEEVDSTRELPGVGIKVYPNGSKVSQDYLYSQISNIEFYEGTAVGLNKNKNDVPGGHLLEYPHFTEGSDQLLVVHRTNDYGITYSLEWDCTKKSQRWTAYEFHDGIPDNNVGRVGSWKDDPEIPSAYQTHESWYSGTGYSKGHMCTSNDRQSSREQNNQTFYISNAMPQNSTHNSGLWNTLENKVNSWGNSKSFRDTLYVVKAGTIRDDQVLEYAGTYKLLVPKYFYMAILCLKDGQYKAIGFWTEHTANNSSKNPADYAISIKELEEKTGIDFFCNLPDDIEEEVQKEYNLADWGL